MKYYFLSLIIQNLFEGVTGVVTQPVKGNQFLIYVCTIMYVQFIFELGLQKEGAVGLLKGTGKGLVGLLVRPTGGLVDLASGTLSFVSRYCSCFVVKNYWWWCVVRFSILGEDVKGYTCTILMCVNIKFYATNNAQSSEFICFQSFCRKTQVGNIEITDIRPPRFIGRDGVG